jgi:hypothetical protein
VIEILLWIIVSILIFVLIALSAIIGALNRIAAALEANEPAGVAFAVETFWNEFTVRWPMYAKLLGGGR